MNDDITECWHLLLRFHVLQGILGLASASNIRKIIRIIKQNHDIFPAGDTSNPAPSCICFQDSKVKRRGLKRERCFDDEKASSTGCLLEADNIIASINRV